MVRDQVHDVLQGGACRRKHRLQVFKRLGILRFCPLNDLQIFIAPQLAGNVQGVVYFHCRGIVELVNQTLHPFWDNNFTLGHAKSPFQLRQGCGKSAYDRRPKQTYKRLSRRAKPACRILTKHSQGLRVRTSVIADSAPDLTLTVCLTVGMRDIVFPPTSPVTSTLIGPIATFSNLYIKPRLKFYVNRRFSYTQNTKHSTPASRS